MNTSAHEIQELDRKGLREFGLVTGSIVAGLFGLFFPWALSLSMPLWPWIIGLGLIAWALVLPDTLKSFYRRWMQFGLLMSRVTTPIIMGAVFFLVVAPVAFGLRLKGSDPMARKFDPNAKSYRIASKKAPIANMEKPF